MGLSLLATLGMLVVFAWTALRRPERSTRGGAASEDSEWVACAGEDQGEWKQSCLQRAFERCGKVTSNGPFEGSWRLQPIDAGSAGAFLERAYAGLVVHATRIQSGRGRRQDFCFLAVRRHDTEELDAVVLWHEDIQDPGDASVILLKLRRSATGMDLSLYTNEAEAERSRGIAFQR